MYKREGINKVLLAGAGAMGSSFAQIFAKTGYEVILYDIAEASIARAEKMISVNLETQVEQGSFSAEEASAATASTFTSVIRPAMTDTPYSLVAAQFQSPYPI